MLFDPMYPALIAVVCQFLRYTDGFRSCCRIYLWNLKNSGEGRMFLNLRVWQHKNLLHTSEIEKQKITFKKHQNDSRNRYTVWESSKIPPLTLPCGYRIINKILSYVWLFSVHRSDRRIKQEFVSVAQQDRAFAS